MYGVGHIIPAVTLPATQHHSCSSIAAHMHGCLPELFECATARSHKQRLAGHGVVEHRLACLIYLSQERRLFPIARVLGVVSIVAADAVGGSVVTVPAQLSHHGLRTSAKSFRTIENW